MNSVRCHLSKLALMDILTRGSLHVENLAAQCVGLTYESDSKHKLHKD